MALYDTSRAAHANIPLNGHLAAFVSRLAAWNEARQTRKALSALTSRELDDIGLMRSDIEVIANRNLR
ncbi:MAG: DUF1127 domain-containing protein [Rhodobacteraceae bacterium]|nr:DUF1127 domain-containing protein [Paracoccaceae bacterium]